MKLEVHVQANGKDMDITNLEKEVNDMELPKINKNNIYGYCVDIRIDRNMYIVS